MINYLAEDMKERTCPKCPHSPQMKRADVMTVIPAQLEQSTVDNRSPLAIRPEYQFRLMSARLAICSSFTMKPEFSARASA